MITTMPVSTDKFLNLIKISDFFKNNSISIQIINDIIMKKSKSLKSWYFFISNISNQNVNIVKAITNSKLPILFAKTNKKSKPFSKYELPGSSATLQKKR